MDSQLVAIYELKRQSFLFAYVQNPDRFDDALAYAYYNRMAPIFHDTRVREAYGADPFAEVYTVKGDFVDAVTKFIDKKSRAGEYGDIAFGHLEDAFGGYKVNRMELIHVLEYARIHGLFEDDVWKAVEHQAPIEATDLVANFSADDVEFN